MKTLEKQAVPKYWPGRVPRIGRAVAAISLVLALASCAPPEAANQERVTNESGLSVLEGTSNDELAGSEISRKNAAVSPSSPAKETKSKAMNLEGFGRETEAKDGFQSKSSTKTEPEVWKKTPGGLQIAKDAKAATSNPERTDAVALGKPVSAGLEAEMRIVRIEETRGEANGIGEIAGSAVLVDVVIANAGSNQLDLSRAQVRLFYGDTALPAATLNDSRTVALNPSLHQGDSTKATFIFGAPADWDGNVLVEFESGNSQKIQQLVGKVR